MAKMYLLGSDVETNADDRLPRLLGIAHEIYEKHCIKTLNNKAFNERVTKSTTPVKQLMSPKLDKGIQAEDGQGRPIYNASGEYYIEIDTTQAEYFHIPTIHANKLSDKAKVESKGLKIIE